MPQDPIPREVLQRAAELVGGRDRLAIRLGVTVEDLKRWTEGTEPPPPAVVFAALGIIESGSKRR